jgi:hypothetical protein
MKKNKAIQMVTIVIVFSIFFGCMKSYGRFTIDDQVTRDVLSGVSDPQLRYYYSGRDTMPYAIIGIDRAYDIHSPYWIEFDPEPDRLKKMSQKIFANIQDDAYGARMISAQGKSIGVWYSTVFSRSVRVDEKKKTVQVLFVNPENDNRPGW